MEMKENDTQRNSFCVEAMELAKAGYVGVTNVLAAFMTIFSGILFYNTRIDISRFQRLVNGDLPDGIVDVSVQSEEEYHEMRDEIAGISGVSQAYGLGWHSPCSQRCCSSCC